MAQAPDHFCCRVMVILRYTGNEGLCKSPATFSSQVIRLHVRADAYKILNADHSRIVVSAVRPAPAAGAACSRPPRSRPRLRRGSCGQLYITSQQPCPAHAHDQLMENNACARHVLVSVDVVAQCKLSGAASSCWPDPMASKFTCESYKPHAACWHLCNRCECSALTVSGCVRRTTPGTAGHLLRPRRTPHMIRPAVTHQRKAISSPFAYGWRTGLTSAFLKHC